MKVVSRTENKTRLENSLVSELRDKFSEECKNNVLVFRNMETKERGYIREEVATVELFYNPFSDCNCFQGRRFDNYLERFLTISSLLDYRIELLESYKEPAINSPEDVPRSVSMKKFIKVKGSFDIENSNF